MRRTLLGYAVARITFRLRIARTANLVYKLMNRITQPLESANLVNVEENRHHRRQQ